MLLAKTSLPKGMNILFWNVRGIGRPSFKPNFRLLVQQHNPALVILVETCVGRDKSREIIRELGVDAWHFVEPHGFIGGILLLWKSSFLDFQVIGDGMQGVYGVIEVHSNQTSFILSSIYASTKLWKRKELWSDLINFASHVDKPWLVVGDFNEVISQNDKMGVVQYAGLEWIYMVALWMLVT